MNPEVGLKFLMFGVSTSAAILLAWACLLARDKLSVDGVKDQGFMLVPRDEESSRDVRDNEHEPHEGDDNEDTADKNCQRSGRDRI